VYSGQATAGDPFSTSLALSADAPPFQPGPYSIWVPAPAAPPTRGVFTSAPPAYNNGDSHRVDLGQPSGSTSHNVQPADQAGPVIVDGSNANKRGKQPVPAVPADPLPDADATRFIRIERVQLDDFHPEMQIGRIKSGVSTHPFLELTARLTNIEQTDFKQNVQKNGIFELKPDEVGTTTAYIFCDSKTSASALKKKFQNGFHATTFVSQQEFEAAGIEIPEEIERLSAAVMLSTHVKQASLSRQFSIDEVTDMAKAAASKFGKILSFKTRYHNGSHAWGPNVARYEVEYDSVKDATDIILNTNSVFGSSTSQAQAEVSHCPNIYLFAELN
jgi:hypothetical protein